MVVVVLRTARLGICIWEWLGSRMREHIHYFPMETILHFLGFTLTSFPSDRLSLIAGCSLSCYMRQPSPQNISKCWLNQVTFWKSETCFCTRTSKSDCRLPFWMMLAGHLRHRATSSHVHDLSYKLLGES